VNISDNTSYHVYTLTYISSTERKSNMLTMQSKTLNSNHNRVEIQPAIGVNIYNQCQNFTLIYPGYFSTGLAWTKCPDWELYTGSIMRVNLIPFLSTFEGILTYQLQKEDVEPDNQSESTCIRLFITWKSEGYKKLLVCTNLIEHDKHFYWNLVKLEEYYQRYANQLNIYTSPIKNTWLTHDGTVLRTRLKLDIKKKSSTLDIFISEGVKNRHTKMLEWIDSRR
jgi:hypothetical protein